MYILTGSPSLLFINDPLVAATVVTVDTVNADSTQYSISDPSRFTQYRENIPTTYPSPTSPLCVSVLVLMRVSWSLSQCFL